MSNQNEDLFRFLSVLFARVTPADVKGTLFALSQPQSKGEGRKGKRSPAWLVPSEGVVEALRAGIDSSDFQALARWIRKLNEHPNDIRINLALRDHKAMRKRDPKIPRDLSNPKLWPFFSSIRGGRKEVAIVLALSSEWDFGSVGHAADEDTLPRDLDEVYEWLEQCDVPEPSIAVTSGHGAHGHWVLDEPVYLFIDGKDTERTNSLRNQYKAFQARFIDDAPFHIDSTAGIEREWRLPGTLNRKILDNPRPVGLITAEEKFFKLSEIAPIAARRRTKSSIARSKELIKVAQTDGKPESIICARLSQLDADHELFDAVQLLLEGSSFATPGNRDNMMQRVVSLIAYQSADEVQAIGSEAVTDLLFRPIAEQWADELGASKSADEECEKFTEKLDRALDDYENHKEAETEKLQSFEDAILNHRHTSEDSSADDSEDTGAVVQRSNGVTAIPRVVRYKDDFYVYHFGEQGYVSRSFIKGETIQVARQFWLQDPSSADALRRALGLKDSEKLLETDSRIGLSQLSDKGKIRETTPEELVDRFGVVAREIRHSLIHEKTHYNADEGAFYIVNTPYRKDLAPAYSPTIDEFLRVAMGDSYELMQDWLAALFDLENPCAALYLEGPPRSGKGFIAAGVASIWGQGRRPTEFEKFSSGNNRFAYIESPLIHLDEGVGDSRGMSTRIRRMITEQNTHVIEHKGKDPFLLSGTLRLLITANNPDAISENGVAHTRADIDAVTERIAYIKMREEAVTFVSKTNIRLMDEQSREDRPVIGFKELVVSGEFANHCAYLALTRTLRRDRLYCATEVMTPWHLRYLLQGSTGDSDTLQWVARMATDPTIFYQRFSGKKAGGGHRSWVGDGKILLRSQEVLDSWDVYMPSATLPSIKVVNRALDKLCDHNGQLYSVRINFLKLYVEQNQIGDWEEIEKNLARKLNSN